MGTLFENANNGEWDLYDRINGDISSFVKYASQRIRVSISEKADKLENYGKTKEIFLIKIKRLRNLVKGYILFHFEAKGPTEEGSILYMRDLILELENAGVMSKTKGNVKDFLNFSIKLHSIFGNKIEIKNIGGSILILGLYRKINLPS